MDAHYAAERTLLVLHNRNPFTTFCRNCVKWCVATSTNITHGSWWIGLSYPTMPGRSHGSKHPETITLMFKIWKQGRNAEYVCDDLPAAASPPLARHSALGICLFPPSFWQNAPLCHVSEKLMRLSTSDSPRSTAQISDGLCSSPSASFIPAASMSVVWPAGWRWRHRPLPGRGSKYVARGPWKSHQECTTPVHSCDHKT